MKIFSVEMIKIYGGGLLFVMAVIIILLFIDDFIRRRMIMACDRVLKNRQGISKLSVDNRTATYLKQNYDHQLHQVEDQLSKKDNIIRYRLYLKKRRFDFYLKKQKLWNYKVLAIKMY